MKRCLLCLLAVALVLPIEADCVSTGASCAILMDVDSGRVLYQKNSHQTRLIASTTKLMTALVVAEQWDDLTCPVTVRPEWTGVEGSSVYLQAGETVTMELLLYGMLLQSGNDAALAAACLVAGSEEAFALRMNEKAAQLGMENTSFENASGLDGKEHYSTAYDMALLAVACLKNETVSKICATRSITMGTRTFVNHNKLLWRDPDCIGMKTGYTERAGRTLVSAARRNGQTLVCVTLNDGDDWNTHKKLLDHGFKQYPCQTLWEADSAVGVLPVVGSLRPFVEVRAAGAVCYPLREGELPVMEVDLPDRLEAPVNAGECVGRAVWRLDGNIVAETELLCTAGAGLDVRPPAGWKERLSRLLQ